MVIFNFPFWIFLRALSTFGISFRPMDCIFPSFTIGASSVLRQTPAWLKTVDAQCWDQNYCSSLSQNWPCTSIFLPIHPCHTNLAPRTDVVKQTINLHIWRLFTTHFWWSWGWLTIEFPTFHYKKYGISDGSINKYSRTKNLSFSLVWIVSYQKNGFIFLCPPGLGVEQGPCLCSGHSHLSERPLQLGWAPKPRAAPGPCGVDVPRFGHLKVI